MMSRLAAASLKQSLFCRIVWSKVERQSWFLCVTVKGTVCVKSSKLKMSTLSKLSVHIASKYDTTLAQNISQWYTVHWVSSVPPALRPTQRNYHLAGSSITVCLSGLFSLELILRRFQKEGIKKKRYQTDKMDSPVLAIFFFFCYLTYSYISQNRIEDTSFTALTDQCVGFSGI